VVAPLVYALCAATALACAHLLLAAYRRSGSRLLLWGGLCFVGLTLNNALVLVDLVVVPNLDLQPWRHLAALGAAAVLVFGLVWDSR
jgi:hypothetical protein